LFSLVPKSRQIWALSLVSVFFVSVQHQSQSHLVFEYSIGTSWIVRKCAHWMRRRFYWRFVCSARTSIRYGSLHSWTPFWCELPVGAFTCTPDPISRSRRWPCCWRLHHPENWSQMGIHHHCQSVFIHFFHESKFNLRVSQSLVVLLRSSGSLS